MDWRVGTTDVDYSAAHLKRSAVDCGISTMANLTNVQTVPDFLAALPPGRRSEVELVRSVIWQNLPSGYEETISKNMLVYQVPFDVYSDTYNGHPLWYVALASEKSYLSLHLLSVYGDTNLANELSEGFKTAGKKLDMDKGNTGTPTFFK